MVVQIPWKTSHGPQWKNQCAGIYLDVVVMRPDSEMGHHCMTFVGINKLCVRWVVSLAPPSWESGCTSYCITPLDCKYTFYFLAWVFDFIQIEQNISPFKHQGCLQVGIRLKSSYKPDTLASNPLYPQYTTYLLPATKILIQVQKIQGWPLSSSNEWAALEKACNWFLLHPPS